LDDEEPTASKKSNKRVKRVLPSKKKSPQRTSKTMATPQNLQQHQFVAPQACLSHPDGAAVPTLSSQTSFPVIGPMNDFPTQWQQSQQQLFHSVPNSIYDAPLNPMQNHAPLNPMQQNQRLQASNGGQGRVISTIGRPRQEDVNVVAFPFLPLSSSFTSLQNMSNQHRVRMSISNDMQGQLAAADLPPYSQQQDLTSRNLLAAGFQSRERLLQPAISSTMVGQGHRDICEITGFSLCGGSRQGLERPQSPEERMQLTPIPLRVQSYAHDVAIHPEETRLMLSRQVPPGVSKQSWDRADGAEYIGEDECHDTPTPTPTLQEDFEPNAIFPPE
jgi:hypothetical protein